MSAVINSLEDDADAHPYDDPDTKDIDESVDGICKDGAGRCTLRAALEEAGSMDNGNGVPCHVTFSVTGRFTVSKGGLFVPDGSTIIGTLQDTIFGVVDHPITMSIGNNTTIRGLAFYGGPFALGISGSANVIAGNSFQYAIDAIDVGGDGNTIGGSSPADRNIIIESQQNGIMLVGNNNVVKGNYIGIKANGDTLGNEFGVFMTGENNVIGGTNPGDKNVISGNHVAGIAVSTITGVGYATIQGNYIGTDPTGTKRRPNLAGVLVQLGSALIGGGSPSERNVISGNLSGGIETRGENLGVTILGNYIGLDVSGTLDLGNTHGIILGPGSFDVLVENNQILFNDAYGMEIRGIAGNPSTNHRIRANRITKNGIDGIIISGEANNIIIGSSLTQDYTPNEIQSNGFAGVSLYEAIGGAPRANTIRKNDFLNNGMKGIDIGPLSPIQDGIQPPTIQNYTDLGNGAATITATHDRAGAIIDVYTAEDLGTPYAGRHWLGSGTVISTNVPFAFPIDACNCARIVATATDVSENTSEFSAATSTGIVSATTQLSLSQGWNMSSVPVIVSDFQKSTLFPSAASNAFAYVSGSYSASSTLANGPGYWVKYNAPASLSMTGLPLTLDTIDADLGWNLIGSISSPVPVASITSNPAGLVTSQFFGYDISYQAADTVQPGKAYWVKLNAAGSLILSSSGITPSANRIRILHTNEVPPAPPEEVTKSDHPLIPGEFALEQNYPNPFNPATVIKYAVSSRQHIRLKIYDVLGREVTTLIDEIQDAGYKSVSWNTETIPSGVYMYRLQAGTFTATKKMLLTK